MEIKRIPLTKNDVAIKFNIPKKVKENYDHLGGFTIGTSSNGYDFAFAARNKQDIGKVYIEPINSGNSYQSKELDIKHGNDLAYYSNAYYLALGNKKDHSTITDIYQFGSNLQSTKLFDFINLSSSSKPALKYISKICHYKDDKFFVGNGIKLALCSIDLPRLHFREIFRFDLNEDNLKRTGYIRAGQGMYYLNGYLYAIFSYHLPTNDIYEKNDIAIYKVTDDDNTIDTIPQNIYEFDIEEARTSDLELFELEGIAAANGTFYVNANQRGKNDESYDCIYQIKVPLRPVTDN